MRFWDTSALVPLMIAEARSDEMRALLAGDRIIVASAIAPVEITSALWRRRHRGELSLAAHQEADVAFADLANAWRQVAYTPLVVEAATDALTRHPLRSLDALQLAAAIVFSGVRRIPFVTLDTRLAAAARAEGFPVVP